PDLSGLRHLTARSVFPGTCPNRALHSFPTRRSSDLPSELVKFLLLCNAARSCTLSSLLRLLLQLRFERRDVLDAEHRCNLLQRELQRDERRIRAERVENERDDLPLLLGVWLEVPAPLDVESRHAPVGGLRLGRALGARQSLEDRQHLARATNPQRLPATQHALGNA